MPLVILNYNVEHWNEDSSMHPRLDIAVDCRTMLMFDADRQTDYKSHNEDCDNDTDYDYDHFLQCRTHSTEQHTVNK